MKAYRKLVAILSVMFVTAPGISGQHLKLQSFSGAVTVESAGKTVSATTGMTLKASDCLSIPAGGSASVFNERDKRVYKSVRTGRITVSRLIIEARDVAADNSANVASKLRFGTRSLKTGNNTYVEKGMVTRSLAQFDASADSLMLDTGRLADYIIAAIGGSADREPPVKFTRQVGDDYEGIMIQNTLDIPIYFNLLSIEGGNARLSVLGQPGATYVMLPGQEMLRTNRQQPRPDVAGIMVMTPVHFDIDTLIEALNARLSGAVTAEKPEADLPVYAVIY